MALDLKYCGEPIITFGVLADVQYADCENRLPTSETAKTRFYRGSLSQVDAAFKSWKKSQLKVKFVLQLGDIIDGLNHAFGASYAGLQRTLSHFEKYSSIPTFHTVGNHELYNFNRKELASLFYESITKAHIPPEIFSPLNPVSGDCSTPVLYYKFSPVPKLKCISLDCFDVSVLGYDEAHPSYKEASEVLYSKHGHGVFEDWDSEGDLQGLEVRFQQMNGALGKEQLRWLEHELKESDVLGQKVIVFGHVGLNPDSSDPTCILWNYEEVVKIFHSHNCVVAYFNGHTHESGFATDSHGISYIGFAGIVETPPDTCAFATVSVYPDRLEIIGHGIEHSYTVPFISHKHLETAVIENELDSTPTTVKVQV